MRAVVFKPIINQFLIWRKGMTPKKILATCNLFHFLFLKVREKTFIKKEKKENQSEKRVNINKTKSK